MFGGMLNATRKSWHVDRPVQATPMFWYVPLDLDFLRGLWIIFGPDFLEFVQVLRTKDGPVARQVVKVVHDDRHKQVDDLPNSAV